MAVFKCTWFFEGIQQNTSTTASSAVGWTETWYREFASIEQALVEMRGLERTHYLGNRLRFLGNIYQIKWLRASAVDNPRFTKTAAMPGDVHGEAGRLLIGNEVREAAQINCAILVDFYSPPRNGTDRSHHRRFLVRGLSAALISGNIIREDGQQWTRFLDFCDYLGVGRAPVQQQPAQRALWTMRVQDNLATYVRISDLTIDATNDRNILVTAPLTGSPLGQKVAIRQVGFPRGVNRIWTLAEASADNGQMKLARSRTRLAGAWDHNGQVAKVVPAFVLPTQYLVVGLRNKKIGSPFRLTRGRRRVL